MEVNGHLHTLPLAKEAPASTEYEVHGIDVDEKNSCPCWEPDQNFSFVQIVWHSFN
jgi:hypothetical protein